MSRAQKLAREQFEDIDAGEVPRSVVFDAIPQCTRRVETKVDFFRECSELVLPRIEDRFMILDETSDCVKVDVQKLRSRLSFPPGGKAPSLPSKGSRPENRIRMASSASFETLPEHSSERLRKSTDALSSATAGLHKDASQCTLSSATTRMHNDSSMCTLLTVNSGMRTQASQCTFLSAVSSQQHAMQVAERAVARDVHARDVRVHNRDQQLAKRYFYLDELDRKQNRKEASKKHEVLLTWMVVGMVVQAMRSAVTSFHESYNSLSKAMLNGASVISTTNADQLKNLSLSQDILSKEVIGIRGHWKVEMKSLMVMSLQNKFKKELTNMRKETLYLAWRKLGKCLQFVVRLIRKRRKSKQMEVVKIFIQGAWRGYQIRAGVKIYFQQLIFLQRGLRACMKYREKVCRYVYLPTVWQIETETVAQITGMATPRLVDEEVKQHRLNWDLPTCLREIKKVSELRMAYSLSNRRKARLVYQNSADQLRPDSEMSFSKMMTVKNPAGLPQVNQQGKCYRLSDDNNTRKRMDSIGSTQAKSFFSAMDKYRLNDEQRRRHVRGIFQSAMNKWYHSYCWYRQKNAEFQEKSRQWRFEAVAMGAANRKNWPPMPELPPPSPNEILKVDTERVHKSIMTLLLGTHGQVKEPKQR